MITLIDTHVHLDHVDDIASEIEQARQAGVEAIVAVGVDLAANRIHQQIKYQYSSPSIFLAFGIHPGNIIPEQVSQTFSFIREHQNDAVAIGEIGLDYWYPWVKKSDEKKQEQRDVFQAQLDLANEFNLPVVIHSRGAWQDCLDMVKSSAIKKAVFHWYSGPLDILVKILDSGYFVSATPALFYSPQAQEAIAQAPIEQTLIETDTPVVYRLSEGQRFKAGPKDVFFTLDVYAKLKHVEKQQAAVTLNKNAKEFFNLTL